MSTTPKWKAVNREFIPFWNFQKQGSYVGYLLSKKVITIEADDINVLEGVTDEGLEYHVLAHHNIVKLFDSIPEDEKSTTLIKIDFVEKKKLKGGKTVNVYNVFQAY